MMFWQLWHWPQWTMFVWLNLMLFIAMVLDGKPMTGKYRFSATLWRVGLITWMTWAGGFWG